MGSVSGNLNTIFANIRKTIIYQSDIFYQVYRGMKTVAEKEIFMRQCKYFFEHGWDSVFENQLLENSKFENTKEKEQHFKEYSHFNSHFDTRFNSHLKHPPENKLTIDRDYFFLSVIRPLLFEPILCVDYEGFCYSDEPLYIFLAKLNLFRLVLNIFHEDKEVYIKEDIFNEEWLSNIKQNFCKKFQEMAQSHQVVFNDTPLINLTDLEKTLIDKCHIKPANPMINKTSLQLMMFILLMTPILLKNPLEEYVDGKIALLLLLMLFLAYKQKENIQALITHGQFKQNNLRTKEDKDLTYEELQKMFIVTDEDIKQFNGRNNLPLRSYEMV